MELNRLKNPNIKIGVKQSLKYLKKGIVKFLYIAEDADEYVVRDLINLANKNDVEIIYEESMIVLGKKCNIDVGAATAVIIENT